jgi:WD40 repeat protein
MKNPRQTVADIFTQALDIPDPVERLDYLDRACASNAALRQEVDSLLAANSAAGEFLQHPTDAGAAQKTMLIPALSETTGTRIGRYKLLEQIGEGGFGVVWMAEQEEPVRRRVALKIIKLGMDTKEVVARFEAERQALAMMDHPHIASIFDGGATETGRPYFVMELVKGVPITDYCDANRLSTKHRLELFMQVCHAVQHAHQKGVIHRDLKPSNILVTVQDDRPVPKVIDFGVAKATQARLTEKTLFTQLRQWIGTPAYMSPEQAGLGSLDVDTRSDIYSLGVLLYELLTGRTPFDTQKLLEQGYDAVMRTIREEEPPKPSTRLSTLKDEELTTVAAKRHADPGKLNRLVHGDLDWIAMKALEKDRTRRYETPDAFANDVERHLNNEPVTAVAPSALYALRKFTHRHKAGLAVAGALIFISLAGTVASIWQAVRASRLAQEELRQRELAENLAVESEANFEKARLNLYATDMALAKRALDEGNLGRARRLLADYRPADGETDLRGFEWRYLWLMSRGDACATLKSTAGSPIYSLAVSPNGQLIAAGLQNGSIELWDDAGLQLVGVLKAHEAECDDVAFPQDGKYLVSCSYETDRVKFWDLTTRKMVREIEIDRPYRLTLSPDGKLLAVGRRARDGNMEGSTTLFETETGRQLDTLPESGGQAVAFSADGKLLVTGAWHGKFNVWGVAERRVLRTFPANNPLAVAFSPASHLVASVDFSGSAQLWDTDNGESPGTLPGVNCPIQRVVFSPDGTLLAAVAVDKVRIWDVRRRTILEDLAGHEGAVSGLAFSPDGKFLVSASRDQTIKLWEVGNPNPSPFVLIDRINLCAQLPPWPFSRDGLWMAVRHANATHPVDIAGRRMGPGLTDAAIPIGFVPDSRTVVALSGAWHLAIRNFAVSPADTNSPGAVYFWNWESNSVRRVPLPGVRLDQASTVALSRDANLLAVAALEGTNKRVQTIAVVDLRSPATNAGWVCFAGSSPLSMDFSIDNRQLAIGTGRQVKVWEWGATNPVQLLPSHHGGIGRVLFSPDGTLLATGDSDGFVRIWSVPAFKLVLELSSHQVNADHLSFSTDSRDLSVTAGGLAKIWHLSTRRELMSFAELRGASFSPDGNTLALVRRFENSLILLRLPPLTMMDEYDCRPLGNREQVIQSWHALIGGSNELWTAESSGVKASPASTVKTQSGNPPETLKAKN